MKCHRSSQAPESTPRNVAAARLLQAGLQIAMLTLALSACGGNGAGGRGMDAGIDRGADQGMDEAMDPETGADTGPETRPETGAGSDGETDAATDPEAGAGADEGGDAETDPGTGTGTDEGTPPETDPQTDPDTDPQTDPDTAPEPDPETGAGMDPADELPPDDGNFSVATQDGTAQAPFGPLDYRVFFPAGFSGTTHVVHVSRGGNGVGDDRVALPTYVEPFVRAGYVVLTIDHRFAGGSPERLAQLRGEEIQFMAGAVARGAIDYGSFAGSVDGVNQGFAGHSGGCMEGLMAAGTDMSHGNYTAPNIRAVFGISPAGFDPDQFGITQEPVGYRQIDDAWVFLVIGEQEKDSNGIGIFQASDWRRQPFAAMNTSGPRFEALVQGPRTGHLDVRSDNVDVAAYNVANALALFDTVLRGADRARDIGRLALPPGNPVVLETKGR